MKSSSEQKIIKMSHLIFVTVWMKTRIPLVKSMNILLIIITKNLICEKITAVVLLFPSRGGKLSAPISSKSQILYEVTTEPAVFSFSYLGRAIGYWVAAKIFAFVFSRDFEINVIRKICLQFIFNKFFI